MQARKTAFLSTSRIAGATVLAATAFGFLACATARDLEYRPLSDEANETPLICRNVEMKCRHYEKSVMAAKGKSNPGLELLRQDCEESRVACANASFYNGKPRL